MATLKGRDLLTLTDLSQDEIYQILSKSIELKRMVRQGVPHRFLEGKAVALIFEKPSTRTRVSFEVGLAHLGAQPIYLRADDLQLGRGETIDDMGKVLSRYVDGIVIRTFEQKKIKKLAKAATVPVINGLTDDFHPCQILADFMTILEKKDRLAGIKLAYVGDGNNVCHSLLLGAAKVGLNVAVATPKGYEPKQAIADKALDAIRGVNHKITLTNSVARAVKGADVIYTDVWASMGDEKEHDERVKIFRPYQVNDELLEKAKDDVLIMHCLPAHRGEEITDSVMKDAKCIVFDQAENRLHTQKALLRMLIS